MCICIDDYLINRRCRHQFSHEDDQRRSAPFVLLLAVFFSTVFFLAPGPFGVGCSRFVVVAALFGLLELR